MIRQTELELHERAKALFEQENPGTLWRLSSGKKPPKGQRFATVIERQEMLARVREAMRREGMDLEADRVDALATAYRRNTSWGFED